MSSYDSLLPTYHADDKSIFEIRMDANTKATLDPIMTLHGVAMNRTDTTANVTVSYGRFSGIGGCIRGFSLMLNDNDVENIQDVAHILTLTNLQQDNAKSLDIMSKSMQSVDSYMVEKGILKLRTNPQQDTVLKANSKTGFINLASISGLLASMANAGIALHPNFVSLKLVIEWETDPTKYMITGTLDNPAKVTSIKLSPAKPLLLIKMISNPDFFKAMTQKYLDGFSVDFSNWARENHYIAAAADDATIRTVFNNTSILKKSVIKAVAQNTYIFNPADPAGGGKVYLTDWVTHCGNINGVSCYSTANANELMQLTVNGVPLLPEACDLPCLKSYYRKSAIGYMQCLPRSDEVVDPATEVYMDDNCGNARKLLSYYAFNINAKVDNFKVDYSKTSKSYDFHSAAAGGLPQNQKWMFLYSRGLVVKGKDLIVQDI